MFKLRSVSICRGCHEQILWSELLRDIGAGETDLAGNLSLTDLYCVTVSITMDGNECSENRLLGPCFP